MNNPETSAGGEQRPLIFDFFEDASVLEIEDQFLFGSEIMVAPVYKESLREREVYLPSGFSWVNAPTQLSPLKEGRR
ncbi:MULTISPECIES: TIM-barrel domain-containing protein [unclassified Oceanispirochaeta]|uniref:TIM-barrel domain-containing protein n=1 Tax=unclassified Oceanispirochaeta TaxID=2635722 RepID=UPI001314EAE7|nr:TIM-barrel domain-containing protein [Oceanispirochaeta sp. M1]MBF9018927.1 hypothetical protein [Oceanispirochaeta sp. M2]NPD75426.1 hypothetical protein [Oceanispirochaeta sp. M1]